MKVLYVVRSKYVRKLVRFYVSQFPEITLLEAKSVNAARKLMRDNLRDLDVIALDDYIDNKRTFDAIRFIRIILESGFGGQVIACTANQRNRMLMRRAGAHQECHPSEIHHVLHALASQTRELSSVG